MNPLIRIGSDDGLPNPSGDISALALGSLRRFNIRIYPEAVTGKIRKRASSRNFGNEFRGHHTQLVCDWGSQVMVVVITAPYSDFAPFQRRNQHHRTKANPLVYPPYQGDFRSGVDTRQVWKAGASCSPLIRGARGVGFGSSICRQTRNRNCEMAHKVSRSRRMGHLLEPHRSSQASHRWDRSAHPICREKTANDAVRRGSPHPTQE
jgi:hypothetical protein